MSNIIDEQKIENIEVKRNISRDLTEADGFLVYIKENPENLGVGEKLIPDIRGGK